MERPRSATRKPPRLAELITVINNPINVSRYDGTPPQPGAVGRTLKIPGGPLYKKEDVISLASSESIFLWTKDAARDAQKWYGNTSEIALLIVEAIKTGKFKGSFWCSQKPKGPWAACDSYLLTQRYWCEETGKNIERKDYLKFAISKNGKVLLSISNHPDGA